MNKIVLSIWAILILSYTEVNALNIDEAVRIALANNYLLEENNFIVKQKEEESREARSAYRPTLDLSYSYDTKDNIRSEQNKHDSELNLTLKYNLFNGFSDKYNLKSYQNELLVSRYKYDAAQHDVILEIKKQYITYLQDRRNKTVQKKAVTLFQKHYEDNLNLYNQGVLVTLNDLLEVEIALLKAKQLLKKFELSETISKKLLFKKMGTNSNEYIEDIDFEVSQNFLDSCDESSLNNRSEIKALIKSQMSLLNKLKSEKGSYYPRIDFSLQHKRYGDSFGLNNRGGSYEPQNIGLVSISWNLYSGGSKKSKIQKYKHQIAQIQSKLKDAKASIHIQFIDAKENYIIAADNIKISSKTLKQARLNYKIAANSFKEGIRSSKDLIDANYLLSQAEVDYYNAYYSKLLSMASLNRVFEKKNI